jgi:hypothetical protein
MSNIRAVNSNRHTHDNFDLVDCGRRELGFGGLVVTILAELLWKRKK